MSTSRSNRRAHSSSPGPASRAPPRAAAATSFSATPPVLDAPDVHVATPSPSWKYNTVPLGASTMASTIGSESVEPERITRTVTADQAIKITSLKTDNVPKFTDPGKVHEWKACIELWVMQLDLSVIVKLPFREGRDIWRDAYKRAHPAESRDYIDNQFHGLHSRVYALIMAAVIPVTGTTFAAEVARLSPIDTDANFLFNHILRTYAKGALYTAYEQFSVITNMPSTVKRDEHPVSVKQRLVQAAQHLDAASATLPDSVMTFVALQCIPASLHTLKTQILGEPKLPSFDEVFNRWVSVYDGALNDASNTYRSRRYEGAHTLHASPSHKPRGAQYSSGRPWPSTGFGGGTPSRRNAEDANGRRTRTPSAGPGYHHQHRGADSAGRHNTVSQRRRHGERDSDTDVEESDLHLVLFDSTSCETDRLSATATPTPPVHRGAHNTLTQSAPTIELNAAMLSPGPMACPDKAVWILDSGSSRHITPHRSLLTDMRPLDKPIHITCALQRGSTVSDQGTAQLGSGIFLHDVCYSKDLTTSLISVSQILKPGSKMRITFKHDEAILYTDRGDARVTFKRVGGHYVYRCNTASADNSTVSSGIVLQSPAKSTTQRRRHMPPASGKKAAVASNEIQSQRAHERHTKSPAGPEFARPPAHFVGAVYESDSPECTDTSESDADTSVDCESDEQTQAESALGTASGHSQSLVELWHARFAHPSPAVLKLLNAVHKLDLPRLPQRSHGDTADCVCTTCVVTKSHRRAIGNHAPAHHRPTRPLELVSADLIGPVSTKSAKSTVRVPSMGGNLYSLHIIDGYSRYAVVVLLPSKSHAAAALVKVLTQLSVYTGLNVRQLHTDGGTEFVNSVVADHCVTHGIKHTVTTVDHPEHNGQAERLNRTLVTKARSILAHAGLPVALWGEALMYAAHVYNATPSSAHPSTTPAHLLTGKPPSLRNIRVFGCNAYTWVHPNKRGKFDRTAQPGVYVGYDDTKNAYRILDVHTRSIISTRDVTLDETKFTFASQLLAQRQAAAQSSHTARSDNRTAKRTSSSFNDNNPSNSDESVSDSDETRSCMSNSGSSDYDSDVDDPAILFDIEEEQSNMPLILQDDYDSESERKYASDAEFESDAGCITATHCQPIPTSKANRDL